VVALAALASVAPLHVVAAVVVVALPLANGRARTRDRYRRRRWERGRRWHDRVTRPAVFLAEAGKAMLDCCGRAALPLAVIAASTTTSLLGLGLVNHGVRPTLEVRLLVAGAAVGVVVWLVHRLESHPRFSRTFGRDLTGWVVAPGGRLSSGGRVVWTLAGLLLVLASIAPSAPFS
jgi:hypothetical protein